MDTRRLTRWMAASMIFLPFGFPSALPLLLGRFVGKTFHQGRGARVIGRRDDGEAASAFSVLIGDFLNV